MAYQIQQFADIVLPVYVPNQDHGGAQIESGLQSAVGGTFDYFGARQRRGKKQDIRITGVYEGRSLTLIDHGDNSLVDHAGNFLITGSDADDLRAQVFDLRSKLGVQDRLWRYWFSQNKRQWVTARLLRVDYPQEMTDRTFKAQLTCQWESPMSAWRSEAQTVITKSVTASPIGFSAEVDGNVSVEDAVLILTATGAITSLRVVCPEQGIDWSWTGTLNSGQSLVIDCGALTVRKAGADAYSDFALASGHTARGWLPLAVGFNSVTITTNGSGTFTLSYYDQWQ